ncbi:hypothetical protein X802_10305 [Thermococcus guaymasensis DSM 11113]|uniref:DUF447 domain-containing protein n=1 Tax=Thermococcus guaymasensis DSM 11113 TaxID=1432656 RepID=A0A0X1KMK6_9EURY|nr:DUF447 domain-containing protein [Thermococcus guaymasensis]AJC72499.1 hypothetical protein X802_10305 [Thermococcus guaymasensis DSM 11113]
MLGVFEEGKVYEVLLVTESNVTPVGVVREGEKLRFKLFPGKSFREVLETGRASIQLTNDPELLVRTALNLPITLGFVEKNGYRWIEGLPGLYGRVERRVERWRDSLGETEVLLCELTPEGEIDGELPLRPFSRADCILVEMAVLFTRYRVKSEESLKEEILKMYSLYTYLGGTSPTARHIVELLTKESQTE